MPKRATTGKFVSSKETAVKNAATDDTVKSPQWANPWFSYSEALALLKKGFHMSRCGWNGKNMSIFYVRGNNVSPMTLASGFSTPMWMGGYIALMTASGDLIPWVCSNADMNENDWVIADLPDGLLIELDLK